MFFDSSKRIDLHGLCFVRNEIWKLSFCARFYKQRTFSRLENFQTKIRNYLLQPARKWTTSAAKALSFTSTIWRREWLRWCHRFCSVNVYRRENLVFMLTFPSRIPFRRSSNRWSLAHSCSCFRSWIFLRIPRHHVLLARKFWPLTGNIKENFFHLEKSNLYRVKSVELCSTREDDLEGVKFVELVCQGLGFRVRQFPNEVKEETFYDDDFPFRVKRKFCVFVKKPTTQAHTKSDISCGENSCALISLKS